LLLNYQLMRRWYEICRTVFPEQARAALAEMARILQFLAGDFGQRASAN
jgi:hypothetical protein